MPHSTSPSISEKSSTEGISRRRRDVADLLAVMARLRDPERGCPWDVQQTFATIAPYTVEEAYEVADAIDRDDMRDLCDELGDLLLQVVFHARMAEERGLFDFGHVVDAIVTKMVRRHPHVFESEGGDDTAAIKQRWEEIKAAERAEKQAAKAAAPEAEERQSVLADVPASLPALMRAQKIGKRVAGVGFDWPDADGVLAKVEEEIGELREALAARRAASATEAADNGRLAAHVREEMGDLLFTCAQLARRAGVDAEDALRAANAKFTKRFQAMEVGVAADGVALSELDAERLEERWNNVKIREKKNGAGD